MKELSIYADIEIPKEDKTLNNLEEGEKAGE